MYISRITEDEREQLTRQHLQECAHYAGTIGTKFAASELCRTVAMFHDIGKFSSKFVEYLKQSHMAKARSRSHWKRFGNPFNSRS